jgi:hypothetical protein
MEWTAQSLVMRSLHYKINRRLSTTVSLLGIVIKKVVLIIMDSCAEEKEHAEKTVVVESLTEVSKDEVD